MMHTFWCVPWTSNVFPHRSHGVFSSSCSLDVLKNFITNITLVLIWFCFMFIFNSMISWALSIPQRFFSIDSSICETAFVFCSSSSSKISWTLSSSLNFILWRWFLKLLLLCLPVHFHLQWSLGPYQIHWSFSFIIHLLKLILASCSSSPSMFSWTFSNSLRVFFHSLFNFWNQHWPYVHFQGSLGVLQIQWIIHSHQFLKSTLCSGFNAFVHVLFRGWIPGLKLVANVFSRVLQWDILRSISCSVREWFLGSRGECFSTRPALGCQWFHFLSWTWMISWIWFICKCFSASTILETFQFEFIISVNEFLAWTIFFSDTFPQLVHSYGFLLEWVALCSLKFSGYMKTLS